MQTVSLNLSNRENQYVNSSKMKQNSQNANLTFGYKLEPVPIELYDVFKHEHTCFSILFEELKNNCQEGCVAFMLRSIDNLGGTFSVLLNRNKKIEESVLTFENRKGIPCITKTEIIDDTPEVRKKFQKVAGKKIEGFPVSGENLPLIIEGQVKQLESLSDYNAISNPVSCKPFIEYFV